MSLIVSLKTESSIFLVADTKVTFADRNANPYLEGISKVSLLDESTCIAFAGNVDVATTSINSLSPALRIEEILTSLEKVTDECSEVHFIVATLNPVATMWLVDNGNSYERIQAWIGDEEGFRKYQSYFTSFDNPDSVYVELTRMQMLRMPEGDVSEVEETYSRMVSSMGATIDSLEIHTVGGFTTPVMTHNGVFEYGNYLSIFRRPIEEGEVPPTGGAVNFGNAETGSFSINFSGQNTKCFAVHIEQANLGILFDGAENIVLKPNIHLDTDEIDFSTLLSEKYQGSLAVLMASGSSNFFKKAESHLKNGDLLSALSLLNRGISISSKTWKGVPHNSDFSYESLTACIEAEGPPLQIPHEEINNLSLAFFMRGSCHFNLGNHLQALSDYRESLTVLPFNFNAMYWKVLAEHNLGKIDDAIKSAKDCCIHHKNHHAFDLCGKLLLMAGNAQEAEAYFENAQSIALDSVNA